MSSSISMAVGLGDVKSSIFQGLLASGDNQPAGTKQQRGPCTDGDPIRWFSVLPPPSLRKAQQNFRRAVETSVQMASIQIRMEHYRALYVELLPSANPTLVPAQG